MYEEESMDGLPAVAVFVIVLVLYIATALVTLWNLAHLSANVLQNSPHTIETLLGGLMAVMSTVILAISTRTDSKQLRTVTANIIVPALALLVGIVGAILLGGQ